MATTDEAHHTRPSGRAALRPVAAAEAGADDAGSARGYDDGDHHRETAAEARLREARERADRYLAELIEEIGEPSPEAVAEAEAWWNRVELALKKAGAPG